MQEESLKKDDGELLLVVAFVTKRECVRMTPCKGRADEEELKVVSCLEVSYCMPYSYSDIVWSLWTPVVFPVQCFPH